MESMKGKLDGGALRVPIPTGSLTDFTANLKKRRRSTRSTPRSLKAAERGKLKGVLKYTEDPIVSSDIVTDPHSCIFDAGLTDEHGQVGQGRGRWYDNEWGYSNRLVDMTMFVGAKVKR